MRCNAVSEEPRSFGPEDITAFLQQNGRPGFARMVRDMAETAAEATQRERRLVHQINALIQKYEPRERYATANYQPPPEASD